MRRFLKLKALFLALLLTLSTLMVLPSIADIGKFNLPTWITETFTNKFKLGLDLQGGLHLEYSVAVDEALENKLDQIAAELEAAFKEKKDVKVSAQRVGIDGIDITFVNPADVATATDDVMGIALADLERIDPEDEPNGVIHLKMYEERLAEARKSAVGTALDTVRRRIDAMGIAEPNIYPKNRQIVIELPGLSDTATEVRAARVDAANRLTEILRDAGAPQVITEDIKADPGAFVLRMPDQDARGFVKSKLAAAMTADGVIVDDRIPGDLLLIPEDPGAPLDADTVHLTLTDEARDVILAESSDFRRLLKIIERSAVLEMRMIDDETAFGDTGKPYLRALYEAGLVTQGMGIAVNEMSDYGNDKGFNVKDPYVFFAKDRETLEQFFANLPAQWRLPSSHSMAYGRTPMILKRGGEPESVWQTYVVKSRAEVTGERIVSANVTFNPETGTPEVSLKLDRMGADRFEQMSGENIGRKMAIMMDDEVTSDPVFNDRIPGGNVRITMGETPGQSVRESANDLVKVLKSGSLPARMVKEFEIRVGADLGKDSVEGGFWAMVAGLSLVILFMAIYYRRAGVISVFALVFNMILILAAMAFFQATLTLPGIAGIVLTIGMAVDANVIVYERIREFIREGYKARAAIEAGYDRAFTTIVDSQLTTAIAGLVLWQYGSGPIRGFAITLLIGIATSIFTAVFATRVFFDFQANRRGFDRVSI
ncbi:MAG: protein translocase subunit SecD [Nannocystaceae bacterium]